MNVQHSFEKMKLQLCFFLKKPFLVHLVVKLTNTVKSVACPCKKCHKITYCYKSRLSSHFFEQKYHFHCRGSLVSPSVASSIYFE